MKSKDKCYFFIKTDRDWYWFIKKSHKKKVYVEYEEEIITIYNPLYYNNENNRELDRLHLIVRKNNGFVLSCGYIVISVSTMPLKEDFLQKFAEAFVSKIRRFSKQWTIDTNSPFVFISEIEGFKAKKIKNFHDENKNLRLSPRFFSNLINWNGMKRVSYLMKMNVETPIYIDILMDAQVAYYKQDYRKSILYSTIAIESMLTISLDEFYNKIKSNKKSYKYRVREVSHKGEVRRIDYIYAKLRKITSFSTLLHEKPLYLMNKSLLLENERLYADAKALYNTRNKIVHLGQPDTELSHNAIFPINYLGSKRAFNLAVEIFDWMNISEFEKI